MITVLLSGGLDSAVLLAMAARQSDDVEAVFVDYGQPSWNEEARAAANISRAFGVRLHSTTVRLECDAMRAGIGEPGPRIVPNRNLVMLAIAANARPQSAEIWFGATAADHEYRDCSRQFAVNASVALGITVRVPLVEKTRAEIQYLAATLGIDRADTWSCYEPDRSRGIAYPALPCGRCNSCGQDEQAGHEGDE